MAQNTTTISILEAIKEYREGNGKQDSSDGERPIDLTTAILSVTVDRLMKKAEMLVGDDSLERHQCARLQFWKLNNKDLDKCSAIRKGYIVRFNGVSVRKDYLSDINSAREKNMKSSDGGITQKLSTCICDFYYSFHKPNVGPMFHSIASVERLEFGQQTHIVAGEKYHIHNSLITPRCIVDRVVNWFNSYHGLSYENGCGNRHPKRRLRELTVPKLNSDVLVRVLQIDCNERNVTGYRGNKPSVARVRVIFIDGDGVESEEDSIPFFIEADHPMLKQIRECFKKSLAFLLKNVVTEKIDTSRNPYSGNDAASEIVLVPTSTTSIDTKSLTPSPKARHVAKRLRYTNSYDFPSQSPSSPLNNSDSSLLSSQVDSNIEGKVRQICCMSGIYFECINVHLKLEKWPAFGDLSRILTFVDDSNCVHYKPATLTIRQLGNSSNEFRVAADAEIMSALCGSYDPVLLVQENDIASSVSDLLDGFMSLEVPLEWTWSLENGAGFPLIETVSLPSLDF